MTRTFKVELKWKWLVVKGLSVAWALMGQQIDKDSLYDDEL